jgi:hypothetical protein
MAGADAATTCVYVADPRRRRRARPRASRVGAVRDAAPARRRLRFDNERPHIDFPLTPIASRPQKF